MSRISIVPALPVAPFAVPDAAAQCSSALAASGSYGTPEGASGNAQYAVYMHTPGYGFQEVNLRISRISLPRALQPRAHWRVGKCFEQPKRRLQHGGMHGRGRRYDHAPDLKRITSATDSRQFQAGGRIRF